ncbi:MAG: flavodoxin [Deltaproteobacteria bacterium]|jgi:flavodoxin short chain|nr:flavodoxin [Deltaproteobacteria bacterium]
MSNVLIVYGSTTGNTEWVAGQLESQIKAAGHSVSKAKAGDVSADGLCAGKDLVLFGCSTWGEDEIELQEDFIPLFDSFDKIQASGVKTAVFGCGDEDYKFFCGAVDAITDKLASLGSQVVGGKLKINGDPDGATDAIKTWGAAVIGAL